MKHRNQTPDRTTSTGTCRFPVSRRHHRSSSHHQKLVNRPVGAGSRIAAASVDYVLILSVILPLATLLFLVVPRMIRLVYEMTITLIGSPLM